MGKHWTSKYLTMTVHRAWEFEGMQWILENWFLILIGGGMIATHLFGHGHGGHGKKKPPGDMKDDDKPAKKDKVD